MKHSITLKGLSSSPTDHESHDGDNAALINLIAEDEALRPVGVTPHHLATIGDNSRVIAIHRTGDYTHLILETPTDGGWQYAWAADRTVSNGDAADLTEATPCPIITMAEPALTTGQVGHTLCLITPTGITYCIWQDDAEDYAVVGRDDLLYDIHLTQDTQLHRDVQLPISPTTKAWLDHPDQLITSRRTLLDRLFPHHYDDEGAYATGATMVAAQMEEAADRLGATLGDGTFRHVSFGVAALRLHDGSHLLCSNLFALLPADLSATITADRESGMLTMPVDFHRHVVTVTLRHPERVSCVADGIDLFVTRPVRLLDLRRAVGHAADSEGRTTSLTFGELHQQALVQLIDQLAFYPSTHIAINQSGEPLLVPSIAAGQTPISLSDLRRLSAGAHVAFSHNGRLLLGHTATIAHDPMEIGLTYRFGDSLTAGDKADTAGAPDGQRAELITRAVAADPSVDEMWWKREVSYPLAGMMMVPFRGITLLEHHLRLADGDGYRYFTTTHSLQPLPHKGMALSVHGATGQLHRTPRPLCLSLLWQQVRALVADPISGGYAESMLLWEEETAADYERHATRARASWMLTTQPSVVRASAQDNPFVFPEESVVRVGDSDVRAIAVHTRRSADGLFGDGQYYVLKDDGVWLLRMSGGKWNAQQRATRIGMLASTRPVATADAIVYLSAQGVMALSGSKAVCLSDALRGHPFKCDALPHFDRLVATEPDLPPDIGLSPHWMGKMLRQAQMAYDAATDQLWLFWPQTEASSPSWPGALVYSFRSRSWGSAAVRLTSVMADSSGTYATLAEGTTAEAVRLCLTPTHRQSFLFCTRPLKWGGHGYKRIRQLLLRGLFHDRGIEGSHVGIALYGSNDFYHWHLVGTSASQLFCCRYGTPFRYFRIVAIGRLLPGESIESANTILTQELMR